MHSPMSSDQAGITRSTGDHILRAAEPEIEEMGETEGDHIVRMGAQDRLHKAMARSSSPSDQAIRQCGCARAGGAGGKDCAVRGLEATGTTACLKASMAK